MYSKVEVITPELAKLYLEKNMASNRSVSQNRVQRYANDMAAGRWQLTSQGITFNQDGVLVDGQHRMEAVIKSGASVQMYVTYGAPSDAYIYDIVRTRTVKNVCDMVIGKGIVSNRIAGAVPVLGCMLAEKKGPALNVAEQEEFIENNICNLRLAQSVVRKGKSHAIANQSVVVAAAFCAIECGVPTEVLKDFFACVNSGFIEGMAQSSAIILRNALISVREGNRRTGGGEILSGYIQKKAMFDTVQCAIADFQNGAPRKTAYTKEGLFFKAIKDDLRKQLPSAV